MMNNKHRSKRDCDACGETAVHFTCEDCQELDREREDLFKAKIAILEAKIAAFEDGIAPADADKSECYAYVDGISFNKAMWCDSQKHWINREAATSFIVKAPRFYPVSLYYLCVTNRIREREAAK